MFFWFQALESACAVAVWKMQKFLRVCVFLGFVRKGSKQISSYVLLKYCCYSWLFFALLFHLRVKSNRALRVLFCISRKSKSSLPASASLLQKKHSRNKAINRMVFKQHFCHSASLHFTAKVLLKNHRLSQRYVRQGVLICATLKVHKSKTGKFSGMNVFGFYASESACAVAALKNAKVSLSLCFCRFYP